MDFTPVITFLIVALALLLAWSRKDTLLRLDLTHKSIVIVVSAIVGLSLLDLLLGNTLTSALKKLPENVTAFTINPVAGTSISVRLDKSESVKDFTSWSVQPQVIIHNRSIPLRQGESVTVLASGLVSTYPYGNWLQVLGNRKFIREIHDILEEKCLYILDGQCAAAPEGTEASELARYLKAKAFTQEHMPLWRTPDGQSPYGLAIPPAGSDDAFERLMLESKAVPGSEWGMLVGHVTTSSDYMSALEVIARSRPSTPNALAFSFPVGSNSTITFKDDTLTVRNLFNDRTHSIRCTEGTLHLWLGVNDLIYTNHVVETLNASSRDGSLALTPDTLALLRILNQLKADPRFRNGLMRMHLGYMDNVGFFDVSTYKNAK